MDYRKEHNGWATFYEHWWFLGLVLLMCAFAAFGLPVLSHLRHLLKPIRVNSYNTYGNITWDTGGVYWGAFEEPGTNRIRFVLLLPAITTIATRGDDDPPYSCEFCDFQIKGSRHKWKTEDDCFWKTGAETLRLRDLTARTALDLNINSGRFWRLDEQGHATPITKLDPAILNKIYAEISASNITDLFASNPGMSWGISRSSVP